MMPPTQECIVRLGQNGQWNFRTMLAVLRCEFLRERAGSATRQERIERMQRLLEKHFQKESVTKAGSDLVGAKAAINKRKHLERQV
jgi:hypothetical protein